MGELTDSDDWKLQSVLIMANTDEDTTGENVNEIAVILKTYRLLA